MWRLLIVAMLLMAGGAGASELKLEVDGNGVAGQRIRIAVYSADAPEQFLSDEKFYRGIVVEATANRFAVTVPELPPGKYAVSAYVDANKNSKHDKNFLGVPTEMYGLSNDARGTFGVPKFSAAAFDIGATVVTQAIHLR